MSDDKAPIEVFCSSAPEDELFFQQLQKRQITPGTDWTRAIDLQINCASIILLLISADFLASDYYYGVEMKRAMVRQNMNEACVVPILVRPVDWHKAPFAHLRILPSNGQAVTIWKDQDKAWSHVVTEIRAVLDKVNNLARAPTNALNSDGTPAHVSAKQQSENKSGSGGEAVPRKTDGIISALANYHSNPEGIYYIGQTLIECSAFLEEYGIDDEATGLIDDLIEEIDTDERHEEGLFDPVISVGKVRKLIRRLREIRKQFTQSRIALGSTREISKIEILPTEWFSVILVQDELIESFLSFGVCF